MSEDEPAENISGGETGGGRFDQFQPGDGTSRAETVVDRLGDLYWQKTYGVRESQSDSRANQNAERSGDGQDAFECLVRTILSQNTSDKASQPAHDELIGRYGGGDLAESLATADRDELAETISAAGLYNQKSETITRIARRVEEEYGGATEFDAFVREEDYDAVREALLDMKGVGPKTADCVLLFAGGRGGVFPVDTHVHRIYRRMGIAPADADHEQVRQVLESQVPAEKCGFGHTASIQFGREYCSARNPACLDDPEACPMADLCEQVGVSPETGEVVDPAEAE
ncbi:endonuclease III domain-containing protein [Halomarina litorea]|uniref:endonuclease III domain-containing protein n=1 Tax=Halomarina litorea TaxID=2961595 RepID=UPI0020C41B4C|nr:endonuclease III [Halomarina sp. BCD28]